MKHLFTFFLLISIYSVKAQRNYIANTANSDSPGLENTVVGASAGFTSLTGGDNSFFGFSAGLNAGPGYDNTFIGSYAGANSRFGISNTFVGSFSGYSNVAGVSNVMIGDGVGYQNNGSYNTFIGNNAGYNNTIGSYNIFHGHVAGYSNTTGSHNIIIGPNAGTTITNGDDNVLIGYSSQAEDGLHNATAIGSGSRVVISNALILGNQANVGIGTSAPTTRLEVVSETPDNSGLRLSNLTTASPATQSTDQFLSVDEKGNVIKAGYKLRINNPSEWSDKVFVPGYQLKPLSEVKKFIDANQHLPGIPSAVEVAKEGVDLVKMNAKLLEKVEELTLYLLEQQKANKEMKAEIDELRALIKK
ncbi:hypothetical protein GO755_34680 [Spirosoma sp. HMF4905]|uniref:TMF family protein n=1 Tax=Spirosoma arboris TaxID=2682092 RepID=A0A7K1SN43_9BACT|nr:hypothetical protein [Spirosoma arboris]MVM35220.1 hypothetical protein [Spirosoma arboris]